VSLGRATALALIFVLFLWVVLTPLFTGHTGDRGDGLAQVVIPKPAKTPQNRPRTWLFLILVLALTGLFLTWQGPSPQGFYAGVVSDLAQGVTGSPSRVAGYITRLHPASQFIGVCFLGLLAFTIRASIGRRLVVLLHTVLYLALSAVAQALTIVVGIATALPIGPFGVEALAINAAVGGCVMMRMIFVTFELPKESRLSRTRPRYPWDSALTAASLLVALSVIIAGYAWIGRQAANGSWTQQILPLYAAPLVVIISFVFLFLLHTLGEGPPSATGEQPPLDIITPAYNEQAGIELTLSSIDRAAATYAGPVTVIVSNDGSTDDTESLVLRQFAQFTSARGVLLTHDNGGKAQALNRALSVTTNDIVLRIDADVVVDELSFVHTAPWFEDLNVGSVGALMMPRQDGTSWYHRMRALECLFQFGLARRAQQTVDGLTVIPGTFVAFRRAPALAFGGFADGMNGEDSDLTLQLGRIGYRAVLDARIRAFEDVPSTLPEFLEQRTRWSRGGLHVFARHNPMRAGLAGPRIWWWLLRRGFAWVAIVAGLIAPIYLILLAALQPTARRTVLTFFGLYLAAAGAYLLLTTLLVMQHRQWRLIAWIPTWYAFTLLRRIAMLEALLSLPTRQVSFWTGEQSGPAKERQKTTPLLHTQAQSSRG